MAKKSKVDVERALKDADYLRSLSPEDIASVPWNPAGDPALTEDELDSVVGGAMMSGTTLGACQTTTGSCLASKRTKLLSCGGC